MIMSNSSLDSQHTLVITVEGEAARKARETETNLAAPAGYTDVYSRVVFRRNSFHCPGGTITVQGSNVLRPNESDDTDWVDIPANTDAYTNTDWHFHWFRVKGVTEGQKVYINSIDQKY